MVSHQLIIFEEKFIFIRVFILLQNEYEEKIQERWCTNNKRKSWYWWRWWWLFCVYSLWITHKRKEKKMRGKKKRKVITEKKNAIIRKEWRCYGILHDGNIYNFDIILLESLTGFCYARI